MKNTVITIFFLAFGTFLTAQELNTTKGSFRINILNPGIGGEFQIVPSQTLSVNFNLMPQLSANFPNPNSGIERTFYFGFLPTFDVEYRFYYNRQKRVDEGRRIYNNTGAYLAPHFNYSTSPIQVSGEHPMPDFSSQFELGGMIGYQKTLNSNLQLGFSAGLGFGLYGSGLSSTFLGNFNFSYIIIPKKWRDKS